MHDLIVESNESEDDAVVTEDVVDYNDSNLLVNSTTADKRNPRDIRKLLSTLSKGNSSSSSTKKIVYKSEININGKIYLEVGNHVICCLSKASRSSACSLVDRGANDGVVANDGRVTEKHPNMTPDYLDVDNNEITSIYLVTEGGVTLTTLGKVIIFMHQCVYHRKNKSIHSLP